MSDMREISREKRELLVEAKKRGEQNAEIAKWLKIGVRSVCRIWKLYKETDSIEAKKRPGRKPKISESELAEIRKAVEAQSDITLEELIEKLNLPIKKTRLSEIIIGMDLVVKKKRYSPRSSKEKTFKKSEQSGLTSLKTLT